MSPSTGITGADFTTAAWIDGGSRVLGSLLSGRKSGADDMGPAISGITNTGTFGLNNGGWTVNLGGPGLNLQGAAGEVPWLLIGAAALAWYLLKD